MKIVKPFLSLVLLCVFLSGYSYAGVWKDTFEERLIGWERYWGGIWGGRNVKWQVLAGFLFANIGNFEKFPPICDENTGDFLHWKISRSNFKQLTIVGEELAYPQEGKYGLGELCLFIGKRQDDPGLVIEGYIVSPEEVSKVTLSKNDGYGYRRGKTKAWYGDKFQKTTHNLTAVFDTGHFQVLTDDNLIAEFDDENIKSIDTVGLFLTCHVGGMWFGSRISSISLTDKAIIKPNLVVQLRGTQLTTTWGAMKRSE